MTANRVETGTKEERMTIKSKRGGDQRILQSLTRGGGGQVNFIATLTKSSVPPPPPR